MYEVDEKICNEISEQLRKVGNFEFNLLGNRFVCKKGVKCSINNQDGCLMKENFFGRDLEYILQLNSTKYPIAFQLYENIRKHYRIFVFTKDAKMLTSVNLTNGYQNNKIIFDIQIKITSPHNISKEERKFIRDECVKDLREYGLNIDKKNHAYLGEYDICTREFFNTTPEYFIKNLLVIGICKNKSIFGL